MMNQLNPFTFELDDGIFIASPWLCRSGGPVPETDVRERLLQAGVQALRCGTSPLALTSYPTKTEDLDELRAIHAAVRTGEFTKASHHADLFTLFGILLPKPVHEWLGSRKPGQPSEDVIRFLTWLGQSDKSKHELLEGQLEASVCERVFADLDDTLITDDQIPEVLRTSQDNHFNLPVTSAYLSPTDWRRIVENGEKDKLQRGESREDV
jgi:hypothetical protein